MIEQPDATSNRAGVTVSGAVETEPAAAVPNAAEPEHGRRDTPNGPRDDSDPGLGVEPEQDDPEAGAVERPFDPARIKIHTVPAVVGHLMSRIEYGEVDLAPDFQRLSGIWNAERKSRLIESLLLRIPIPSATSPRTRKTTGRWSTGCSGSRPSATTWPASSP